MAKLLIQSIQLEEQRKSLGSIKKLLFKSQPMPCERYVKRDGYLIRYSSNEPQYIYAEILIEALRELNLVEIADGTFRWLKNEGGNLTLVTVEGWVPKDNTDASLENVVEILDSEYTVYATNEVIEELSEPDLSNKETDFGRKVAKRLTPLPFELVNRGIKTQSIKNNKNLVAYSASGLGLLLIASIGYYVFYVNSKPVQIEIPQKVEKVEIDNFSSFRKAQEGRVTLGRALYVLLPTALTVREGVLPFYWNCKEIYFEKNALHGTLTSSGKGRIGRVSELKSVYDKHKNGEFVHIDGQDSHIDVPITPDGDALVGEQFEMRSIRDRVIDTFSLLKAKKIATDKIVINGKAVTQKMTIKFDALSPLMLGRISRITANLPIYVNKLTAGLNGRAIDLSMEVEFVGVDSQSQSIEALNK